MDLPYLIRRAAAVHPNSVVVDDGTGPVNLASMVERAERFANSLDAAGVEPGIAIGILSGNRREYPEIDFGIALGRRTRVALNARQHLEDFRFALIDAGARVLVHSGEFGEQAAALAREIELLTISLDKGAGPGVDYESFIRAAPATAINRGGDDEAPAWITYTSGTTGRPKGIVLSHRSLREVAMNLLLELGPVSPGEHVVLTQPLSHGAGYFVLPWVISGCSIYVTRHFDPEEIQAVGARPEVRTLKIVPAMLPSLLELPNPVSYPTIVYGAAPIAPHLLEAALDRFGPVLVQIYGQSEAPVTITCLRKEDHVGRGQKRLSAGRPFRSVAVEVRDPEGRPVAPDETGEVTVRGHHMMTRYNGLPSETAETIRDGWVWTKDMAKVDSQGYVYLLGRSDEMINSGGFNISPREVERVILEQPGVIDCAVVGVPDERWGSAVAAAVCQSSGTTLSAEAIIDGVKSRLGYRTPRKVVIVSAIPRNAYGKVDRRRLRDSLDHEEVPLA